INPADSDPLHQTLASQGALLEQHHQALSSFWSTSQSLLDLSSHLLGEPFVPAPKRYNGNLGACRAFVVQCSLVYEQQPYADASERAKISFLIGSVCGTVLSWAMAVFTEEMRRVFGHNYGLFGTKTTFLVEVAVLGVHSDEDQQR
uniref:DUF4939 domain-containing protein n=1 Tax=Salmo trutta TaxID=8032 RepID=A0A673W617_SALTR